VASNGSKFENSEAKSTFEMALGEKLVFVTPPNFSTTLFHIDFHKASQSIEQHGQCKRRNEKEQSITSQVTRALKLIIYSGNP